MEKPALSAAQVAVGYQKFLAENPSAKAQVDAIPQEEAEALGVELSKLHMEKTVRLLCQRAAELGLEDFEYLLQLSVDDEDGRRRIRQARQDEIDRCLGIS